LSVKGKTIRHLVAFLFIAGTGQRWTGLPAAMYGAQAREREDFVTEDANATEFDHKNFPVLSNASEILRMHFSWAFCTQNLRAN
jgi:hypothetical protein